MPARSKLWVAATLLVAVTAVGVLGYRLLEGYAWLDALYMTVITLSTVGFQELRPLSPSGRIFTIALVAGGVGVAFYTAVAVVGQVVEGELRQLFGRKRMEKRIRSLSGHYVVCGFGRVGEIVCRELQIKPVPFVVIEQAPDRLLKAEEADCLVLRGDATDEPVLLTAGVPRARGLFATLPTDADNVFVTLTAKELNPALVVVARAETDRSDRALRRAGADTVISPYAMGGHRMAQAVLRPAVVDVIELATHHQSLELQLEEVGLPAGSPYEGVTLGDSELTSRLGVIVVAIKRASGPMVFNPAPAERLEAGDRLVALADAGRLKALEREVTPR
jgi:voltage-gated potassium channel